jgi:hypothetical protein
MQRKTIIRHTKYLEGGAAEQFKQQIAEEGNKMAQEARAESAPMDAQVLIAVVCC